MTRDEAMYEIRKAMLIVYEKFAEPNAEVIAIICELREECKRVLIDFSE